MRIKLGKIELIIIFILFIIIVHVGCSCRESYSNINAFNVYADAYSQPPNTKDWEQPSLLITPTNPLPQGVADILSRPKQPIPLPNGQLDMLASTSFSPKCCPNTYSNSLGCACMTVEQQKYLTERGGNNVPPEF